MTYNLFAGTLNLIQPSNCLRCSIEGSTPTHSSRVTSHASFCITPYSSVSGGGFRSDLLRSVHNRTTQLSSLPVSDTSPSRASPANSNSSPRGSQASVTSTGSSASSRISDAKDTDGVIVLKQDVCTRPMESDVECDSEICLTCR